MQVMDKMDARAGIGSDAVDVDESSANPVTFMLSTSDALPVRELATVAGDCAGL